MKKNIFAVVVATGILMTGSLAMAETHPVTKMDSVFHSSIMKFNTGDGSVAISKM